MYVLKNKTFFCLLQKESAKNPIKLPLLYPCGNLKTDKLGSILDGESIPYEAITVYNTVKNPELDKNPHATTLTKNVSRNRKSK